MNEIVVVGAGPVGLMTAIELRRRDVAVRIIDAADGPAPISRALGNQGRTMEIYHQLGVLDELLANGVRTTRFIRHFANQPALAYDFGYSTVPTRYPFILMVDQTITERVLRDRLAELGTRIEWSTRLEELSQDTDGVQLTLIDPDGVRKHVRAPWLVGCDGAHSVVRKQLGIPLRGESSHTWLVIDAEVDAPAEVLDPTAAHWLYADGGAVMAFPLPEPQRWRLTNTAWISGSSQDPDTVAEQFRHRISAATGAPTAVRVRDWIKPFKIQQRAVPTMRSGRCFVAGDAAHVHSPAGGQGMNTGLQDAFNLGWKLAAVATGEAEATLLETYSQERVPVGSALLDATAMITDYVMNGDTGFAEQSGMDKAGREIIGRTQAIAVRYDDSPLTETAPSETLPEPGERVTRVDAERAQTAGWRELLNQLRDPRWLAVHHNAVVPTEPWLNTLPADDPDLRADLDLSDGDWILVRPDGYVAARGTTATPIHAPYSYPTLTPTP